MDVKELKKSDDYWVEMIDNNLYAFNEKIISKKKFINNILLMKKDLEDILNDCYVPKVIVP